MDFIRINCPMAVLTEAMIHQIKTSFSLLLSFHQSPYGLILIKSKIAPQQNSEKSLFGLFDITIHSIAAKIRKIF